MSSEERHLPARPPGEKLGRFDWTIESVGEGEDGVLVSQLIPNPKRYEELEHNGELCYFDKYTRILIPARLLEGMLSGLPLYVLHPRIKSTIDYGKERADAVREELVGLPLRGPSVEPAPHTELGPNRQVLDLAFISVDICDSTSQRLSAPYEMDKALEILLRELQTLAGQFEATVLKSTGDGFIAYIAHPSFTRQCDMVFELGLAMLDLSKRLAIEALKPSGLPPLQIRIGMDYGTTIIEMKRNVATGFSWQQQSSDALNRAVKTENTALPGTMRIGGGLRDLLHTQWIERTAQVAAETLPLSLRAFPVYEAT
ncbi:adenylate/guanylate cyclase domain-containing protein [Xanthomonas euvesicatoria]|uniref:adenylate/guanylate cyclase domain-containing protein n=1 Tax=Xanthomonas euvesicatoria TaxID=456327 RepID=UPI0009EC06E0|nr:adenylate/guanylate cyclase domain-containing protein [Xanthomonas euvesicatoria]